MPKAVPIYCDHCHMLAVVRIDGKPFCMKCTKSLFSADADKSSIDFKERATPLKVVRHREMDPPSVEDLKS
ncbi:MAG: hypothetical protein JXX29_23400 [Deltaproteobacteria bacterium]|nr:hypothetical protein [Deltaproteobacteria bacterium]